VIRINLLPERRARTRRLVPESGVALVALIVVGSLAVGYLFGEWRNSQVRRQTDAINQKIKDIRPKVAEVLALQARIDALRAKENLLRSLEAKEIPWAETLTDLAARTPSDAWLTSAAVTAAQGQTHLTLAGTAMSYTSVAQFMVNLGASRFYSEVDLQGAQGTDVGTTPGRGFHAVQFGVSMTFRPVTAITSEVTP
jgi:Tfp pilus assembly protein PilN